MVTTRYEQNQQKWKFKKYFCYREEKVKAIVDDILDKIPDQFNMAEIMQKVEERTPYVIVAFQV